MALSGRQVDSRRHIIRHKFAPNSSTNQGSWPPIDCFPMYLPYTNSTTRKWQFSSKVRQLDTGLYPVTICLRSSALQGQPCLTDNEKKVRNFPLGMHFNSTTRLITNSFCYCGAEVTTVLHPQSSTMAF